MINDAFGAVLRPDLEVRMTSPQSPQPSSPAYPPAPYPPAPQPEKRSWFARHKVLTALGVVIALVIVGAAISPGGGDDTADAAPVAAPDASVEETAAEPAPAPEPPAEEGLPGIGDTVADGKFEFVVTQVETGVATVGSEYINRDAQGQFILVHLRVTNIGDQAQRFSNTAQKAIDDQGRTHSADTTAAIYMDEAQTLLAEINPGNTLEGVLIFDVGTDVTLTSVELHDSSLSRGVTVALS